MGRLFFAGSVCIGITLFAAAPAAAPPPPRPLPLPSLPGPRVPSAPATSSERAARAAIQATGRPEEIKKFPSAAGVVPLHVRPLKGKKPLRVPLKDVLAYLRRLSKPRWYGLYHDMTEFSKWGFESHACRFVQHEGKEAVEMTNHKTLQFSFGLKQTRTRYLYTATGTGALLRMESLHTRKGVGQAQVIRKQGGRWVVTRYHVSNGQQTELETKRLPRRPRLTLENGDVALFAWLAQGKARAGDGFHLVGSDPTGGGKPPSSAFQVLAVLPRQGPAKSQTWYKVERVTSWKSRLGTAWTRPQMLVDGKGTLLLMRSGSYRHRWETETEARWIPESLSGAQTVLRVTAKRNESEAALQGLYRLNLSGLSIRSFALERLAELRLLEELNLSQTLVDDRGLKHLHPLKRLRVLWLKGTKVTLGGVRALRQALPGCKIRFDKPVAAGAKPGKGASVAQRLAHWLGGHGVKTSPSSVLGLQELGLPEAKLSNADLVRLGVLQKLTTLSLRRTGISNAGLAHLQALPKLTSLNLSELDITDAGLKSLIPLAGRLTELDLEGTLVTDNGLKHLTGFRQLTRLRLPVQISAAAESRLKKSLDGCVLSRESSPNVVRMVRKDRALHSAVTGCNWRLPLGSILAPTLLLLGWLGLLGLVKRFGRPTRRFLEILVGARSGWLLVLGGGGLLVAGLTLVQPLRFTSQARSTEGSVVQLRRTSMTGCMGCSVSATRDRAAQPTLARTTYSGDFGTNYLVIRFQPKAGQAVIFQSRIGGHKAYRRLGSKAQVLYDPKAPRHAMLKESNAYISLFFTTGVIGIMALLLLVLGVIRALSTRRRARGDA